MQLKFHTEVTASSNQVWNGFNESLFRRLSPSFPRVEVTRFDGCNKGDEVHLDLFFPFFTQSWNSLIIESGTDHRGYYFIDQGIRLPFFLTYWEHKHHIKKCGDGSVIIDHIVFKAHNIFFELFVYPVLWFTFFQRKAVYQQVFGARA